MKWKRVCSILLAVMMLVMMIPATVQAAMFRDIAGHWAEADIEDAVERELFRGTSDTTFSPDTPMTRGMFVTVLYRADSGCSEGREPFVDVSQSDWYYDAVCWANECELVRGTDETHFSPDLSISREQMITILYRYLEYTGAELEQGNLAIAFLDQDSISAYAVDAVEVLKYAHIINGKPATNGGFVFDPQGETTRAEVARVFCRFLDGMYWPDDDPDMPDGDDLTAVTEYLNQELSFIEYCHEEVENDYVLMDDAPDALAEMKELADEWEEEGLIQGSNVNDDNICITLAGGLRYMYVLDVYELRDTAGSVRTYEPYSDDDPDFEKYQARYGYIDAGARAINDADSNYPFKVDLDESEVKIEELLKIGKDSIVLWLGHGNYDEDAGSVLWTGDQMVNGRDTELWAYSKGLVLLGRKDTDETDTRLGVTAEFFDHYFAEGSLSGSLFWLATCSSHEDDKLAASLRNKGATTVIGSTWSIGKNYLARLTHYFTERLTTRQSDGSYYTAGEALDYAKDKAGAFDRDWTAVMELTGSSSFRLNAATLDVLVVDSETKSLVPDAKIKVEDRSFTGKTDENGKAVLSGLQSETEYTVTASKEGYETASGTTRIGYTKGNITLYLKPETIDRSGKVMFSLQDEEGNPLSGVTGSVTIYENGSKTDRLSPIFTSSELTVQALEPGKTYEFRFTADGYLTSKVEATATASPTTAAPVTMKKITTANTGWTVSLTVKDNTTQAGIAGATVTVSGGTAESGPFIRLDQVTTGSGGTVKITVPGEYSVVRLDASAEGYESGQTTKTRSLVGSVAISLVLSTAEDGDYIDIYTAEEFTALTGDESVRLMKDISLAEADVSFPVWFGVLEGNGHTISGITCASDSVGNQSANGCWLTSNRGTIRNVTFSGVTIQGTTANNSSRNASASLFYTNYGTIQRCTLQGSIMAIGGNASAAGFVLYNYGAINNCSNQAEVIGHSQGSATYANTAGIALYNRETTSDTGSDSYQKGTISGCINSGSIRSIGSSLAESSCAGITLSPGTYSGCSNSGSLSAENGVSAYGAMYNIAPAS